MCIFWVKIKLQAMQKLVHILGIICVLADAY